MTEAELLDVMDDGTVPDLNGAAVQRLNRLLKPVRPPRSPVSHSGQAM